jgi:hypothetical protein
MNNNSISSANSMDIHVLNPLAEPKPWWNQLLTRIRLFPWWLCYNIGLARQADLKNKIIQICTNMELNTKLVRGILRHAVSEFSKNGLGSEYYGYHNIDHELEVTYFSLLAANGQRQENRLNKKDIHTLFVAALFHDYDPLKQFDKPNENSVEWFIRNDYKIKKFIDNFGINLDIVIALIHRTAYPFKGKIADYSNKRMQDLFKSAGIPDDDTTTRAHYYDLGWFLSISDRIAGYSLGNIEHSKELARRNAHSLGWHPSVINEESVKYFTSLKEEKKMFHRVLEGVPEEHKKNFFNNVIAFREAWAKETELRSLLRSKKLNLIASVEKIQTKFNPNLRESLIKIYRDIPVPMSVSKLKFAKSLFFNDAILITLRITDKNGEIVGYVKGGPAENYSLRHGTHDENLGKNNTAFMEWICIKQGYWGESHGHLLRSTYLKEAKRLGYSYVTSYVHRNVIMNRMDKGETIEIVQKYDPDKLDYYRTNLAKI